MARIDTPGSDVWREIRWRSRWGIMIENILDFPPFSFYGFVMCSIILYLILFRTGSSPSSLFPYPYPYLYLSLSLFVMISKHRINAVGVASRVVKIAIHLTTLAWPARPATLPIETTTDVTRSQPSI